MQADGKVGRLREGPEVSERSQLLGLSCFNFREHRAPDQTNSEGTEPMTIEATPEQELVIQATLERSRIRREAEIARQAAGGKRWWASFELLSGEREIHSPSWVSGYGQGPTIVFAAIGESEDDVMDYVENSCLDEGYAIEWRFVNERADDFIPPYTDRFPGPLDWHVWPGVPLLAMEDYLAEARRDALDSLRAESTLTHELRSLSAADVIRKALVDSGALYEEEADEVADDVADYLRRAGKLIEEEKG